MVKVRPVFRIFLLTFTFLLHTIEIDAQKEITLDDVEIVVKPLREKKFGVKKRNPAVHFIDGMVNQKHSFEIAQVIKLPAEPTKITSLNLYINDAREDSCTFRINFYRFNGERPTERLLQKSIVQRKAIKTGWLNFNLRDEQVYLKSQSVISLEFIPSQDYKDRIEFEVKLGGSTRTFLRVSNEEAWNVPPHHYIMYATALVPDNWEENESESVPLHRVYSKEVNDTFSIFVQLPLHYNKKENYPVMYLLDANAYFDAISQQLRLNALRKENKDAILVGIGYRDAFEMDSLRDRDYTCPQPATSDSCRNCGGGEKFYDFISKELIPFIENNYRCDKDKRTLMGHSLGGFFSLYALQREVFENTSIFKYYVSASPELNYSDKYLFKQYANLPMINSINREILLSVGGKEPDSEVLLFKDFMNHLKKSKLFSVVYFTLPTAEHMEIAIPSFNKGLNMR
jgi:predicted alpha/beta superfamily hydrolase